MFKTIDKYGLKPAELELEITESALIESIDDTIIMLQKLAEKGIKTALDDFGTGYSSLSYLRRLPVSTVKLDKYFISELGASESQDNMISPLIELLHFMNLKVTAEGIEEKKQFDYLKERNCDSIQGFLYSKPLISAR